MTNIANRHILPTHFDRNASVEEETSLDEDLKKDFKLMLLSDFLKVVHNFNVSEDVKRQALNSLPNLPPLQNLVYYHSCSEQTMKIIVIDNDFDFATLLSIARQSRWFDIDDIAASSIDHADIKRKLINTILDNPDLLPLLEKMMPTTLKGHPSE